MLTYFPDLLQNLGFLLSLLQKNGVMIKEESIKEYYFRINKTIDYIKANLHTDLSLNKLARQANFSKYHFHRIFKSVTGTALNDFIMHARIERSIFFLINHSTKSIRDVALECGFRDTSSFSRCFKKIKGISSSEWRLTYKNSKICQTDSKISTWPPTVENYLAYKLNKQDIMNTGKESIEIKVQGLPALHVAYVRNLDVHIHDSATFEKMFKHLFDWAGPKGLINFP